MFSFIAPFVPMKIFEHAIESQFIMFHICCTWFPNIPITPILHLRMALVKIYNTYDEYLKVRSTMKQSTMHIMPYTYHLNYNKYHPSMMEDHGSNNLLVLMATIQNSETSTSTSRKPAQAIGKRRIRNTMLLICYSIYHLCLYIQYVHHLCYLWHRCCFVSIENNKSNATASRFDHKTETGHLGSTGASSQRHTGIYGKSPCY